MPSGRDSGGGYLIGPKRRKSTPRKSQTPIDSSPETISDSEATQSSETDEEEFKKLAAREDSQVVDLTYEGESNSDTDSGSDLEELAQLDEMVARQEAEAEAAAAAAPAQAAPARKRKRQSPAEKKANVQKRFDNMDAALKEFHPELKSVFEDLNGFKWDPVQYPQPDGINATLLPYQKEGLAWMRNQEESEYKGGILADEMGLGKTLQTISLIVSTSNEKKGANLVVAPTVAVMQWRNEIERFTGNRFKVLVYHGAKRSNDEQEITGHDIVLTTYAILESNWRKQQSGFTRKGAKVKEKSVLHNIQWHRIILDEAHNIKDRNSSTTTAVVNLQGLYRLCLSGTPLQNRVGELYSLLRFLQVKPFNMYFCTKCECSSTKWNVQRQKCVDCGHVAMQHVNFFNHSMLKHIQRLENQTGIGINKMRLLLNRIMLRRTKVERADELGLPPRIVTIRRDYFNEEEKDLYKSIYGDSKRTFNTFVNHGVVLNNYANIFTLITRMRQLADHPDLVLRKASTENADQVIVCKLCDDEAEDPIKSKCHHTFCRLCITEYVEGFEGSLNELECPVCHILLTIDLEAPPIEVSDKKAPPRNQSIVNRIRMDDTWRSSTKIEALLEELFKLRSSRNTIKSIVFSQFTSMLDLIEWRLARAGFSTVKLQGNLSPTQRDSIIKHFMDTPSVEVFLVSLKAGGVALNLCEASQVFLMDPWWNPSVEWQSGDRVHRIGQHRPVTITRLVIEDSIESRIVELQEKKANMINATIGSDDSALNRLTQGDMEFLFQN